MTRTIFRARPRRGSITTCATCGSADVQVTAWIKANGDEIIDGEPPTDQVWCPHCDREVDTYVEEVDPEWWASNGYRCLEPACVPRKGCETCQLYVCGSCAEVRHWSDGGVPDPRCEACFNANPDEHVEVVLSVRDAGIVCTGLLSFVEPASRRRAVSLQETARALRNLSKAPNGQSELAGAAADAYARAREATEEWASIDRVVKTIARAVRAQEGK